MSKKVGVIEYGAGNLSSVLRAINLAGGDPRLISGAKDAGDLDLLIIPGVGAFNHCMSQLEKQGLDEAISQHTDKEKPLLGICLGMQLLMDVSSEFGMTDGLGLIPGKVLPIPPENGTRIPRIGWSTIEWGQTESTPSLLKGTHPSSEFYFAHSYHCHLNLKQHKLASSHYQGLEVTAVIKSGNISGVQFHPELSGKVGSIIFRNFINQV